MGYETSRGTPVYPRFAVYFKITRAMGRKTGPRPAIQGLDSRKSSPSLYYKARKLSRKPGVTPLKKSLK